MEAIEKRYKASYLYSSFVCLPAWLFTYSMCLHMPLYKQCMLRPAYVAVIAQRLRSINLERIDEDLLTNCLGLHSALLLQASNIRDKNKTENLLLVKSILHISKLLKNIKQLCYFFVYF